MIEKQRPSLRVIYTPESPIRRPLHLGGEMLSDLAESRTLAWRLLVRDVSAQYRQTMLGYLWALLPPIITTVVWVALNKSQIVNIHTGAIPYPVFALTGTIFWQLFFESLNAPLRQLGVNKSMLNRVNFPTEALLLSGMGQVLFAFMFKALVLGVALIAFQVTLSWTAVFVVVPIFAFLAMGTAIGMFLAPTGLLYKDIDQALFVLVGPLMYLAPVVYPQPTSGYLAVVMRLNALTPVFNVMRWLLFGGATPSLVAFALVLAVTFIVAGAGWVFYRLALPVLIERLEA